MVEQDDTNRFALPRGIETCERGIHRFRWWLVFDVDESKGIGVVYLKRGIFYDWLYGCVHRLIC